MSGDDPINAGKTLVGLTPVATAPGRRKIGTAKGDFEVPEDFNAPLPDRVLDEFESD
jgi:hypothetical protein